MYNRAFGAMKTMSWAAVEAAEVDGDGKVATAAVRMGNAAAVTMIAVRGSPNSPVVAVRAVGEMHLSFSLPIYFQAFVTNNTAPTNLPPARAPGIGQLSHGVQIWCKGLVMLDFCSTPKV